MVKAFVAHSFLKKDKELVRKFTDFFDSIKTGKSFDWKNAEDAKPTVLSNKVRELMIEANVVIAICTSNEGVLPKDDKLIKKIKFFDYLVVKSKNCNFKISD